MNKAALILFITATLFLPVKLSADETKSQIGNSNVLLPTYNFAFQGMYLQANENSSPLTAEEITRKQTFATLLNLFFGFGCGSFYQGDAVTGYIGLFSDITSASLFTLSYFFREWQVSSVFFPVSVALAFITRIYQFVAPSYFADLERLRNGIPVALRTDPSIDFLMLPRFQQDQFTKTWELEGLNVGATYRF